MRLLYLLTPTVLAVPATAQALSDFFTVSNTCAGRNVDQMVSDTVDMANNAISVLLTLTSPATVLRAGIRTELISSYLNAANTAFGITIPGFLQGSLSAADAARLTSARNNYQMLVNAVQSGASNLNPVDNFFYCDSANLAWTTHAADVFAPVLVPDDSPLTVTEFFQDNGVGGIAGVWRDNEHTNSQNNRVWVKNQYPNGMAPGNPICGPNAAEGLTFGQSTPKQMFLCPVAWDTNNFQSSLRNQRDMSGERAWDTVMSLPGVFLHEMMHWLPIDPHVEDVQVIIPNSGGQTRAAYGVDRVWILSGNGGASNPNQNKALTLQNADSYHVFATMAYLPGVQLF